MAHAFRVVGGVVRETRVIDELTAPSGFVLASAGEFEDVTNVGLAYRSGIYRWAYTGGQPDSVAGALVPVARPVGATIVKLDRDGYWTGGISSINDPTAPAGHIMISPAQSATLAAAGGPVYPDRRRRFLITGGTRLDATGTLVEQSDVRPTGEWSHDGDTSRAIVISRLVGVSVPDAVLTVSSPAPDDGEVLTVQFGDRTLALTFNDRGQARVPIPMATKATRGDGVVLGESRQFRMRNTLTVQAIGRLELE